MKKTVSIIGYGRFGKTLHKLLGNDFKLSVYDLDKKATLGVINATSKLAEAFNSNVLFLCIPIGRLEEFVKENQKHLQGKTIVDVLSVKSYPKKVYKKYLKNNKIILSHPMFGPDSSKEGFDGLTIMIDKFTADNELYRDWKKYFKSKGLKVVEMTAENHDKIVAKSQAMTHIIGRVLRDFGYQKSEINTVGDKKMIELIEHTCNDDIDLFYNMQNRNPYTKLSRRMLQKSINKVFKSIVDNRCNKRRKPMYGVQGGVGSFNDQAIHEYITSRGLDDYKIAYLHTTKNVLKSLDENEIDYGMFAVSNSRGGIVEETSGELGKHYFEMVEIINLPIQHYLMAMPGVPINEIKKIMAHPQVFKQCEDTLAKKYPNLVFESGKGDAIDSAKIARLLSIKKLSKNIAVMGPKRLAEIYKLCILDKNLQDDPNNTTNFMLVKR